MHDLVADATVNACLVSFHCSTHMSACSSFCVAAFYTSKRKRKTSLRLVIETGAVVTRSSLDCCSRATGSFQTVSLHLMTCDLRVQVRALQLQQLEEVLKLLQGMKPFAHLDKLCSRFCGAADVNGCFVPASLWLVCR